MRKKEDTKRKSKTIVRKDIEKIKITHKWWILIIILILLILLYLVILQIKIKLAENEIREINQGLCESGGGVWNECGNKCEIENLGKEDIVCPAVCEEICECGTIDGLGCPSGYTCILPENVADAGGYCEKI